MLEMTSDALTDAESVLPLTLQVPVTRDTQ